jgi:hypothetical protein
MPTIHKPQLDHESFPWHEQSNQFHKELEVQRAQILGISGFNKEFGDLSETLSDSTEKQRTEFIRELSGILSFAAAIKMDAGYKPANKLIATLKSIEKNPSLILTDGVEPEALGSVAQNYQRGEEEPGTFWFDVDRSARTPLPDLQRVRKAALVAIEGLEKVARSGRPRDLMLNYLADSLLARFLRFNDAATRHSIASDGDRAQAAAGPFIEFLTLIVGPLNEFLVQLAPKYGANVVSAPELARRALCNQAKRLEAGPVDLKKSKQRLPGFPHN